MMIIGTIFQDYGDYFNSFEEFRIYLVSLTFYSSDYSVCFKPHPSAKITQEFGDMMNESKVPIIETQVPGETIMAAFEDVKVGVSGTADFVFAKSENDITAFYRPTIKTLDCKNISMARDLRDRFGDEFVDGKDDKEETSSSIPENTNINNDRSSDGSSESDGGGVNQSSDPQSTTTKVAVAAVVPIVILVAD